MRSALERWWLVGAVFTASCAAKAPPPTISSPSAASPSRGEPLDAGVDPRRTAQPSTGETPAALPEPPAEPAPPERHPFHEPMPTGLAPRAATAMRLANLSAGQCRKLLRTKKLPFEYAGESRGIANSRRVTGRIHGVKFRTAGKSTPYGKLDCRLALALEAFAEVLAEHDVVAVHVDNMYRPGARLPGKRKRSQHHYGLALDVSGLELADGRALVIDDDWRGEMTTPVCGPEATMGDPTPEGLALRNVFCAVARRQLFHHILTPNYNAAHSNHVHLDIKRDAKKTSIR